MERRKYGTGTIIHLKNGEISLRKYYGVDSNGKAIYKYFKGATEKEAQQKAFIYEKDKNVTTATTVIDYADNWIDNIHRRRIENTTYMSYKAEIQKLRHYDDLADLPINVVTSRDVQNFIDYMTEQPYNITAAGKKLYYSKNSIKKTINVMRALFKYAVMDETIALDRNPATTDAIYVPREKDVKKATKKIGYYSKEDCKKIENVVLDEKLYSQNGIAIVFLLESGLRIGELLALTVNDIDIKRKKINVNKQYVRTNGTSLELKHHLKTASGTRKVPLTTNALRALVRLNRQEGLLFQNNGKPLNQWNITRTLRQIEVYANTEKRNAGLHVLRHSYASNILGAKMPNGEYVDIKLVSIWLGHGSIELTYNVYADIIQEREDEAIFVLDSILA